MTELRYCKGCFEKQQRINTLERENEQLGSMMRYQKRSAAEGPFGSATPSSKVPFKPNALSERQERRGGGKEGHAGHGRRCVAEAPADRGGAAAVGTEGCPECGGEWRGAGSRLRTVTDLIVPKVEKVLYRLERRVCP